ncbi:hypothetical protein OHA44_36920 [Streptomyces sp. NBC_00144]|uniref:hypothetical protein n=1 Tax=Streptomyces sp. NBC_00144 TaxID=2975665 RepID=UPI0032468D22
MLRKITSTLAAGALLAGLGLATGGTAQAAPADGGGYWARQCDYGRACLELSGLRTTPDGNVWNIVGCGDHGINDHYDHAYAHGNDFWVYYQDGRSDMVTKWVNRPLDPSNVVIGVAVFC